MINNLNKIHRWASKTLKFLIKLYGYFLIINKIINYRGRKIRQSKKIADLNFIESAKLIYKNI
jgi:hypothetical protein